MKKSKIICIIAIFLMMSTSITVINVDASSRVSSCKNSEDYAVIMVGRYFPRLNFDPSTWGYNGGWTNLENIQTYYNYYLKDAGRMYSMLKDVYGYDDDHIYLLVKTLPKNIKVRIKQTNEVAVNWKTYFDIPDDFDPNLIDYEYSHDEEGFKKLLNTFKPGHKNALEEDDSLFVTFIDHGGPFENDDGSTNTYFGCPLNQFNDLIQYFTYILSITNTDDISFGSNIIGCLQDILKLFGLDDDPEALFDYEFANYVQGIKAKQIYALQPCHSGGFIKELSAPNRIICTSVKEGEISNYGWIGPFRRALGSQDGVNADYNNDGNISIREAYEYSAKTLDERYDRDTNPNKKRENALIDDNGDGVGHHYTDCLYVPGLEGFDGYLADNTFLVNHDGDDNSDDNRNKILPRITKFRDFAIFNKLLEIIKNVYYRFQ